MPSSTNAVSGKKILVTGGCGYIGAHVVLALMEQGATPIILDDLSNGDRRLAPTGAALIEGDCGDERLLAQIMSDHKPAAVMHFAGKIVVPESVADPLPYYEGNTVKSRTLIAFAASRSIPMVFSSTAAVYGAPSAGAPIRETDPLVPINPYGRSKLMTEWMLEDASRAYGLRYAALRYFNVAGADAQGRAGQIGRQVTHLIRVASQVALGVQDVLTIYGDDYDTPDGTCIRDYIHVSDLADAHVAAVSALLQSQPSVALNCGHGAGASVLDILRAFETALGRPLPHRFGPRRAGDPPRLVADSSQLRTLLKWTPRRGDLVDIVRSAMDWEKRVRDGRIGQP